MEVRLLTHARRQERGQANFGVGRRTHKNFLLAWAGVVRVLGIIDYDYDSPEPEPEKQPEPEQEPEPASNRVKRQYPRR